MKNISCLSALLLCYSTLLVNSTTPVDEQSLNCSVFSMPTEVSATWQSVCANIMGLLHSMTKMCCIRSSTHLSHPLLLSPPYDSRLLKLIEMPTLDSVLSHDAVDGKNIVQNAVLGLVPRPLRSGTGHGRSHPSRPRAQGECSPVHTCDPQL